MDGHGPARADERTNSIQQNRHRGACEGRDGKARWAWCKTCNVCVCVCVCVCECECVCVCVVRERGRQGKACEDLHLQESVEFANRVLHAPIQIRARMHAVVGSVARACVRVCAHGSTRKGNERRAGGPTTLIEIHRIPGMSSKAYASTCRADETD